MAKQTLADRLSTVLLSRDRSLARSPNYTRPQTIHSVGNSAPARRSIHNIPKCLRADIIRAPFARKGSTLSERPQGSMLRALPTGKGIPVTMPTGTNTRQTRRCHDG